MRVIVNGLPLLKARTGVGHHIADLTAALGHHNELQLCCYPGTLGTQASQWFQSRPQASIPASKSERFARTKSGLKSVARTAAALHFASYTRAFPFDLYHEPNFVPFRSHLPTVVTIHDLSVLKYPHWHPVDRVKHHEQQFLRGLNWAEHFIVVSEAIRQEMIHDLHCPPERVTTIYNGIRADLAPQPPHALEAFRLRYELPESFLLYVGTVEPRKNLLRILQAYADLPNAARQRCPLILAGPWGWHSEPERDFFHRQAATANIRHLGYLPSGDRALLYGAARALVYPSYYEGFGLPPVEMLACGGAVLASTATALQEVLGPHAAYTHPEDTTAWRAILHRAMTDDDFLTTLRAGSVAHAKQYTWQAAAQQTVAVYRAVLGQRKIEMA